MIMDRGIVLECCFTSNLQTKAVIKPEDHPIYSFYKNGMKVTINTDNMTVSNTDIRNEHLQLKKYFPFSDSDFLQMDSYAVDAAFLPASEKDKLRLKLKNQKEPD